MHKYKVKSVRKVVDGDTVDIEIDLGFYISKVERIRLKGIDAPETRTSDSSERTRGKASKRWLEEQLSNYSELTVETFKDDKYGRMLGILYKDNQTTSLNEMMLTANLAEKYL